MSINLSGATFANQRVTPSDDGAVFAALCSDGIAAGCEMNYTGTTLRMSAGKILACGRLCRVPGTQEIPITDAASGYARLVLNLDLSKTATKTAFEQAQLYVDYSSTIGGFPSMTRQDLNNGGTVYQVELCILSLGAAGITGIVRRTYAHGRARGFTVTLTASGWNGGSTQTVAADVLESDNVVATYAVASRSAWLDADVYLSGQADGYLTFTCAQTPDSAITVNVLQL